jgi:hydrophobe/amphiphile efflux-1 (HAE1) family protein
VSDQRRFTDLFIERPVLALVVSALLLLLGIQAAGNLQIREFPEIEKGVIRVNTVYPGASARTVQGFVTSPLQRRIASARGVEYMTSESNPGFSTISVHVKLGENTSNILTEVITKVNEARFELPRDVEDPVVSTSSGGDAMMYIAFLTDTMTGAQVTDYLMRVVQPELTTVPGVGQARILSSRFLSMRVWLNPARMAAFGVTAEDVSRAIQSNNYISASGTTKGAYVQASVDAETDMQDPADFADIVVRQNGDQRVRLGDVAELELAQEDNDSTSFSSGQETVFISITEAPGANPLLVARGVHKILPRLEAQMPADMTTFLDFDGSIFIEAALTEVTATLLEACLIVILIIYLFLGYLRVVLIPLVAIPLSLIGVLFFVYTMGFSLNLLTLLAMVIAIGLVVDDAIVVVENVDRHIEAGKTPMEAAIVGARQVAFPVIAMTLTLAAVYAPIGFLGGLTGILFTEFAFTLAAAVVVSGVVALTLSPMMCSRVLKDHTQQGAYAAWLDHRFEWLKNAYRRRLGYCLRNRGAVLLFSFTILASLPVLFQLAQRELAPEEDSGGIFVLSSAPAYANIDYLNTYLADMVDTWKQVPEVSHAFQLSDTSFLFGGINLVPWNERDRSQQDIQRELQAKFAENPGLEIFTFGVPALPGSDAGLPVNFVLASTADYREIEEVAERVVAAARESGLFIFINQSLEFNRPEVTVSVDRDKAARLGISMQSVGSTLAVMLGNSEINRFSMQGRSYKVIPQAARGFRLTKEWLERYYIRTSGGDLVPLSTIIQVGGKVEPKVLSQYQQLNSTTLQGMLMPPNTMGTGLAFLEEKTAELAPTGYRVGYEGESRRFIQESQGFALLFAVSLLLIFLVLAAQFNSFRDPFVVLISVPLSIFGAVVPLALGIATLNIYTQVGLLTLIGLISKHGILIVDFANQLSARGMTHREAVLEAATLRLRPILMTTFATVLGVFPLLIAYGAGANSRFSIGLMIAAGMLVGTLFTLFVLPVFYIPFRKEKRRGVSVIGRTVGAS